MSFKYRTHRLEGRVAVITASTKGIGYAIADRLGHEGAKLVISSRKQSSVDQAIDQLVAGGLRRENVSGIVCHAADEAQQDRLLKFAKERYGKINILVCNHGISPYVGNLMDIPEDVWDRMFEVNCRSAFLLTQKATPYLKEAGGGAIVYTGSVAGYKPQPKLALYGITKTVILAMTKAFAQGLADMNIRVNCVAPGIIKTDFSKALWDETSTGLKPPTVNEKDANDLGRHGTPEEVAAAVAYLVSDDSSYVTGESHVVSGGVACRL
ncbi:unnamed protein product [Bursaphelenchus okinawaensis]|uniref:Uncharacterized protein n=1 Tax=Bursaphelenchus okinawaensis TaxID=465554 RepID=A0A811K5E6_9BILA|nr:unnamed protein product [Bursaphelenchus okinawaensis]CAG9091739.1 unnamed protein product [Bursaphelenchus okinawaensis]